MLERFESEKGTQVNLEKSEKQKNSSLKENNFHTFLLKEILNTEECKYDVIGVEHKNQIETISDNIMALVNNLLNILGKEVEIKRSIEDGIDHNLGK